MRRTSLLILPLVLGGWLLSTALPQSAPRGAAELRNDMLIDSDAGITASKRWAAGQVAVYFVPAAGLVQPMHSRMAWQAFGAWQQAIGNVIVFKETAQLSNADIYLQWVDGNAGGWGDVSGYCQVVYDAEGYIQKGRILIDLYQRADRDLYLHEIGHCIGLMHSSNPADVMYYQEMPGLQGISADEAAMARMLYSQPPGAR